MSVISLTNLFFTVTRKHGHRCFSTNLSEQHLKFKEMCRKFAEYNLKPIAAELDRDGKFPAEQISQMSKMGLLALNVPKQWGGLGLDKLSTVLGVEEIARCCGGTAAIVSIHNFLYMNVIAKNGTEIQKEEFLKNFENKIGCFALTEQDAGSDVANISTTAVLDGDCYILNGTKSWVTSGVEGKGAVIFATVDKKLKHKGITAFMIKLPTSGLTVDRIVNKMGIRASSTCDFILNNVIVPKSNVLGEVGNGFHLAMVQFDEARVGIAAQALGIAQAAFELAVQYATERNCFGHPLNEFQAVKIRIADMATRLESARLAVWRAAYLSDQPQRSTKETSIAKLLASEAATYITHGAIQMLGGLGITRDMPAERLYRDARITEIYGGVSEIQRLVIGESIIKEYKK